MSKKLIILTVLFCIILTLICFNIFPVAAEETTSTPTTLVNPLGTTVKTVPALIQNIIKVMLGLIGALSLVMFIYGGFLMLTSQGKTEQIEKGKNTLVWAVLGIAAVFGSYTLLNFILTRLS